MPEYKSFAIDLAYQAGKRIKDNFSLGMEKEWKEDNTPLTVTDIENNKMVIEAIREKYPNHSIVGEEASFIVEGSEYSWICDPVDGTFPFSHGIPTSVFSLALTKNGESILGVIYDPYMDRLFFAEKGQGAYLNGKKISVSDVKKFSPEVAVSVEGWGNETYPTLELSSQLRNKGVHIFKLLSIVYCGMLVASGELGAVMFPGTKPWDCAALKILIEEAGGKATNIHGKEQRYDGSVEGFVATNGLLHDELIELISETVLK